MGNGKTQRQGREFVLRRAALTGILTALLFFLLPAAARALTIQDCHRVTSSYTDTRADNKSVVRLWHVETALPSVTEQVNSLAEYWAEEMGKDLPAAVNSGEKNSRLDVEIRYSRTGLTWMSFLIQARTHYHQELTAQQFTTRTYDMITGKRIILADIFNDDDSTWDYISKKVREGVLAYWPEEDPDPVWVDAICRKEALAVTDFTLHGMSLVIHFPADILYADKKTIMDVTLFYPDIRGMMTEKAWTETNNLSYYKTCALTFDDGPSTSNTGKVLDSLMETGARATFFVIGNRIADYEYLVQREHDNGHAVASHNWHHGNVTKSSDSALRAMPEKVNRAMIKAIGIPVRYDRVPGGRYPNMISAGVNWAYIQWSLDTYDWRGISTPNVLSKVKKKIEDGDIILCHDIKDNTPESTRQVVRYLEEEGYLLLTVDELFAKDGVVLEPRHVYYRCANGDTSVRSK